jgi:hypothetical protein
MKNVFRIAAAAAVLLLISAAMGTAQAACPLARSIGPDNLVITAGGGPTTYAMRGVFWSFASNPGGGNPADGLGNDSGTIDPTCWIYNYPAFGPTHLDGGLGCSHWNAPGVDGCIDTDPAPRCNVILLSDQVGGVGYFAIASVGPDAGQDYIYSTVAPAGIDMAPVPKPNITGSVRNGTVSVDLNVTVPPPAAGTYLGCQSAGLQSGSRYRIYTQGLPRGSNAPTDRDLSNWSLVPTTAAGIPVGQSTTVNVACGGADTDFYLCTTLLVPTGNGNSYELVNCSQNATRVECGTTLADPIQRRPARPKGETLPDRGGRR